MEYTENTHFLRDTQLDIITPELPTQDLITDDNHHIDIEAVVAEPEAVVAEPEAVVAEPEVVSAEPEAVVAEPEVVSAEPEAVVAEPEAVVAEPEAVVADPEAVVAEPEAVVAEPEVVSAEPEAVVAEPEAVVAEPEAVVAEPEAVVAEPEFGIPPELVSKEDFSNPEVVTEEIKPIPKIVFIVPYRDRKTHLKFFSQHMAYIMEDVPKTDYTFLLIHQDDTRGFNRGAVKNIGFLRVKHLYPDDYKKMTLVFNDVDTMPKTKNYVNYETTQGIIKHFCGFTFTLGGIVCINAFDFERINGFPNFWGWGYEDNLLQMRAIQNNIQIDRSIFCDFEKDAMRTNFISLHSGVMRNINKTDFRRYIQKTREGIYSIQNIHYNTLDNSIAFLVENTSFNNPSIDLNVINVKYFHTGTSENIQEQSQYDLRKGATPFGKVFVRRNGVYSSMNMIM
jgi:hypothetical protein